MSRMVLMRLDTVTSQLQVKLSITKPHYLEDLYLIEVYCTVQNYKHFSLALACSTVHSAMSLLSVHFFFY